MVLTTPYFIPDEPLLQAMQTAVLRGVEVHLVVSEAGDPPIVTLAQESYYEELLQAGIHVITTLNIQHLESLYDLVEKSTGVKVKERIPDYVLAMADQLVNVDLPAEDLRERLLAGKVYAAERVPTALENFFTPANLTRLRELARS